MAPRRAAKKPVAAPASPPAPPPAPPPSPAGSADSADSSTVAGMATATAVAAAVLDSSPAERAAEDQDQEDQDQEDQDQEDQEDQDQEDQGPEAEAELAALEKLMAKGRIEGARRAAEQQQRANQSRDREMAQRRRTLEVDVFRANSVDFVHLLQGPFYVHRVVDSAESDEFRVSRACRSAPGEFIACWDNGNLVTHPSNRGDIAESYRARQIVARETLDPGRRGAPAPTRVINGTRMNPDVAAAAAANARLAAASARPVAMRQPPAAYQPVARQRPAPSAVAAPLAPAEPAEPAPRAQGSFGGFKRLLTEPVPLPPRTPVVEYNNWGV
jgi:hypothetical protein